MKFRYIHGLVATLACASSVFSQAPIAPSEAGSQLPALTGPIIASSAPSEPGSWGAAPANGSSGWIQTEYLLWWLRGMSVPALAATGTGSSTGVLGQPGTQVLFGDSQYGGGARSGGRVTAGWWFDPDQTCGIQASYFMLAGLASQPTYSSNGSSVLTRPFYNTLTGAQDAQLIGYPGVASGSLNPSVQSGNLLGTDVLLRCNLWCCSNPCSYFRVDGLVGYRFLYLAESVNVGESLTSTSTTSPVPPGTTFAISDGFATTNQFNGGEIGFSALGISGPWMVNLIGKVAFGNTQEFANVTGSTTITTPGAAPVTQPGGILAVNSNMGRYTSNVFSVVPEVDFNVGYQLSQRWTLTAGYTFLYWSNVARPGSEIDTNVNPNHFPPPIAGGDGHPAFSFGRSGLWAQGLSLGLLYQF